jgi:hypothetical protein
MPRVNALKEQIILEVRIGLLRHRKMLQAKMREKMVALLEETLESKLNELITEATNAGFTQGQNSIMKAMNG